MKPQDQINQELMNSQFNVAPNQDVNYTISRLNEFMYTDETISFATACQAHGGKGGGGLLVLTSKRVFFINCVKATTGFEFISYNFRSIKSTSIATVPNFTNIVITTEGSITYHLVNTAYAIKMHSMITEKTL